MMVVVFPYNRESANKNPIGASPVLKHVYLEAWQEMEMVVVLCGVWYKMQIITHFLFRLTSYS